MLKKLLVWFGVLALLGLPGSAAPGVSFAAQAAPAGSGSANAMLQSGQIAATNDPSPATVIEGETVVTFTVTVANIGIVAVNGLGAVNPHDMITPIQFQVNGSGPMLTTFDLNPGDLAVGTYTSITPVVATTIDPITGQPLFTSTVTVTNGTISAPATAEVIVVGRLVVTNAPDRLTAAVGDTVTFTVTVYNTSSAPITNLGANNPHPPGAPVAFSVGGGSPATSFDLLPGQSAVGSYTATVNGSGTFSSTINVTNGLITQSGTGAVTIIPTTPGVRITKSASPLFGEVGDNVTYTIRIENTGTQNITSITVNDPLLGGDITARFTPAVSAATPLSPGGITQASITRAIEDADGNPVINAVTVTAQTASGATLTDTANASVSVLSADSPDIQAVLVADDYTANVGQQINYTAIITNRGTTPLTDVTAYATASNGGTVDLLQNVTLSPNSSAVAAFNYTVQASDGPALTWTLYASGTSGTTNVQGSDSATVTLSVDGAVFGLLQAINCSAPCRFFIGDSITFRATAINTGLTTLTNVRLTSPQMGTIASGLTLLPNQSYNVDRAYVVPYGVSNTLFVSLRIEGTDPGGTVVSSESVLFVGTVSPSISVTLSTDGNQTSAMEGTTITYIARIANMGNTRLTNIAAIDSLYGSLVNLLPARTLEVGQSMEVRWTRIVQTTDPDSVVNTTTVTGVVEGFNRPVTDNDTFSLAVLRPKLVIGVTANRDVARTGETIEYTVTIANLGIGPISSIAGSYTLGSGIIPTVTPQPTATTTGGQPRPHRQGGTVTFNLPAGSLNPGEAATGTFSHVVVTGDPNPLTYTVNVTGQGLSGVTQVTVTASAVISTPLVTVDATGNPIIVGTPIPGRANPEITKSSDVPYAIPGGIVTWTLTVRNPGEETLDSITITDTLPLSLTAEGVTISNGTVQSEENPITAVSGPLAFNETVTLTIITRVTNEGLEAGELIQNIGCANPAGSAAVICDTLAIRVTPDVSLLPTTGRVDVDPAGQPHDRRAVIGLLALLLVGLLGLSAQEPDRGLRLVILAGAVVAAVIVVVAVIVLLSGVGRPSQPQADAETQPAMPGTGTPIVEEATAEIETATQQAVATSAAATAVRPTPTSIPLPTSGPSPTPTPPFIPQYERELFIPRLNLNAPMPIVEVPLRNRTWDVRDLGQNIGFLEGTTWVSEADAETGGNTVLAGHIQIDIGVPGPFRDLNQIQIGDSIFLAEQGTIYEFRVFNILTVAPNDVEVAYPTSEPTLTLITCTTWNEYRGVFDERFVVQAHPVRQLTYNS